MLSSNAKLETFLNKQLASEAPLKRKKKIQAAYCQPISLTKKPPQKLKPLKQSKKLTSAQKKIFRGKLKNSDLQNNTYSQFLPLHHLHNQY